MQRVCLQFLCFMYQVCLGINLAYRAANSKSQWIANKLAASSLQCSSIASLTGSLACQAVNWVYPPTYIGIIDSRYSPCSSTLHFSTFQLHHHSSLPLCSMIKALSTNKTAELSSPYRIHNMHLMRRITS